MTIYYADDWVTLHHGDNRPILAALADQSIDLVLTDPPYTDQVHNDAVRGSVRNGSRHRLITFAPLTQPELWEYFNIFARLGNGWVISFLADDHTYQLKAAPPAGLSFVRAGVWIKPNAAPHVNQDRPSQGWESIAMLHRDRPGKYLWHGLQHKQNHSAFIYPIAQSTGHAAAKPLPLISKLIVLFSNPGDLILDPFGGSGSTAVAAKRLGRRCIIIEQDERYCEIAARRLSQDCMDLEAA